MGLHSHFDWALQDANFTPKGRIRREFGAVPPTVRCTSQADCSKLVGILRKGGMFNPKKTGKYTIKLMPLPRYGKRR